MEDCIFCKIAEGKIPCSRVYEDAKTLAFLDIMPANKGHCLIIPKAHSQNLVDTNEEDLIALMKTAKKVAKALSLSFGNASFNIVMNNGKEAGQVVFHTHIHLIPRFQKDRLRIRWSHLKYEGNEMKEHADRIRKFI